MAKREMTVPSEMRSELKADDLFTTNLNTRASLVREIQFDGKHWLKLDYESR